MAVMTSVRSASPGGTVHGQDTLPKLFNTPEIRVPCPDDVKFEVVKRAVERFRAKHEVVDVDGARVKFPDGWGLVRASNTQPVLVVRAEGTTPAALDRIKTILMEALRRYPEVAAPDW